MIDLHTHLWPHAPGTALPTYDELARWCDRARGRGVDQIAITEHCHRFEEIARVALESWRPADAPALRAATERVWDVEGGAHLDDYVELLTAAQRRGLPLLVGLEVDALPGADDAMAEVLEPYPFDVLLGSVHWLGSWPFDAYGTPVFANEWERRSVDEVWDAYVDAVIDVAQSGRVDVLAHVDLIKVAGFRPSDVDAFECRLCDAIAVADVAVEVSTAALRKQAGEAYPSPTLLRRLHDAGVPLTTASDAHEVDQIGFELTGMYESLRRLGVTTLATFAGRERRAIAC